MASVTTSLNALTSTTNGVNNNGLQYKILSTSSVVVTFGGGDGFELCIQEIERQVQAAIQEGFVPHGSLAHSFVTSFEGHTTLHMTQPMVRQQ